jgi:hypothetical protein
LIFEILGRHHTAPAEHFDLCSQFAEGLAAFQRKEWKSELFSVALPKDRFNVANATARFEGAADNALSSRWS